MTLLKRRLVSQNRVAWICLEFAQTVMTTWYQEPRNQGHAGREAIEIVLALFQEHKLTDEYKFPENVKRAMKMVLKEE